MFLPGYALAANVFAPKTVGITERGVYAVVLSIAITAVGGLVIQLALGLGREVWAIFLAGVTLYASLRILVDRQSDPLPVPSSVSWRIPLAAVIFVLRRRDRGPRGRSPPGRACATLRRRSASPTSGCSPAPGPAPKRTTSPSGLRSHEGQPRRYALELTRDGEVLAEEDVRLRAGEKWEKSFAVSAAPRGVPVVAVLDRDGAPYRRLDVTPPP